MNINLNIITKNYKELLKSTLMVSRDVFYEWGKKHYVGIFVFNIIIIIFVLLQNAGYFNPFLPITTNLIVMLALLLAVVLLGLRSRGIFTISLIFLTLAGILLYLRVEVWAERTMIYVFQSFTLGVILLFFERTKK